MNLSDRARKFLVHIDKRKKDRDKLKEKESKKDSYATFIKSNIDKNFVELALMSNVAGGSFLLAVFSWYEMNWIAGTAWTFTAICWWGCIRLRAGSMVLTAEIKEIDKNIDFLNKVIEEEKRRSSEQSPYIN